MGKGLHFRYVHLPFQVHALCLFREHYRYAEIPGRNTGNPDSRSLDGEYFVNLGIFEPAGEFLPHLLEQLDVHLVVQETVHL